ncbi:HpcH/HpaI aldolase/citrate lyase family protein [Mesorhizobium japonicum]|uniref:Citrate lyase beta-subunit n=1 Tax=Mesorhizobium japonicum (strain LMG 29417 / CECT 9101 / MAFF 303099) TaxID=266835 RepID=Q98AG6_RHILO|nr:CoA ester lyase [Mesorhizobium japonicum]BAB52364.1 citrate lyase beta-subunit [Mesorhizobium japonicum MAFF 303099]
MRSLLFVPGDSARKQDKAMETGADLLILDLEDSVALSAKEDARKLTRAFVERNKGVGPLLYVRVNDLSTALTDADLEAVMPAAPDGIMLPKANHADHVTELSARLCLLEARHRIAEGETRILPLITETAEGVLNAPTHARPNTRLSGLTWGAEDLSASVGALVARDYRGCYTALFQHARTMAILAAAAAGVPAVDTVYPDFRNEEGFASDCAEAVRDGFTAKMAIHPGQVSVINAVFTPSPEAVAQAKEVVEAFARSVGAGVISLNGKMYDRPHLRLAERLLARLTLAL